ncbi:hypothetical protein [Aeromonas veronii]|uniref:hypothetical protein n=1 Tax=Aeromonas veronii TaxID=654 RepID=UPI001E3D3C10|nr:hypothetical protein [Aeromonas veronii]MCD6616748.1 hypothetical protein [Aeromonas veronii]
MTTLKQQGTPSAPHSMISRWRVHDLLSGKLALITLHQDPQTGQQWLEGRLPGQLRCSVENATDLGDSWEEQLAAMSCWMFNLMTTRKQGPSHGRGKS